MRAPRSGCCGGEFVADRHEPRHFGLGNLDFLAAPVLERKILDDEIGLSA